MTNDFHNYVVIVTGSYRGNGKAIAKKFIESGAKVYGIDFKYKRNEGTGKFYKIKADLSKLNQIIKTLRIVKKKEKRLDILVNNAGVSLNFNRSDLKNYWDKTLDINLKLPFLMMHHCLPLLKKSKNPSIINISSLGSKIAMSNNPAYNASKAGLSALTFSFALDYAKHGIRVNSISPGYIKTEMTKKSYKNKKKYKTRIDRMMIKKYGSIEDVANASIFLSSTNAKYINAEDLVVDGGLIKKGI